MEIGGNVMKETLVRFQIEMDKYNLLKDELVAKKEEFQKKNAPLIEGLATLSNEIEEIRDDIKTMAEEEYSITGHKQLIGGIGIRVGTNLIYDRVIAFDWAKEHAMCLSLDRREFEKVAKITEIPFVEKVDKVTVTFPPKIEFQ